MTRRGRHAIAVERRPIRSHIDPETTDAAWRELDRLIATYRAAHPCCPDDGTALVAVIRETSGGRRLWRTAISRARKTVAPARKDPPHD